MVVQPDAQPCCSSLSSGSCISEQLVEMEETAAKVYCCRVCFEEELNSASLVAPCKCKGTQKYVHTKCLRRWQENVQKRSLTDERAYRCGVCRSVYTIAPPDPRWLTRILHTVTGLFAAAGISLLVFGVTASPWPHLALLLLVLLGTRSHALLVMSLLLAGSALAALHVKGLRLVMRLDGGGRLGLAVVRHGAPIPGLGAGTLLVASEDLEHSMFQQSVVLVYEHGGPGGARGVILTQAMRTPPAGSSASHSTAPGFAGQRVNPGKLIEDDLDDDLFDSEWDGLVDFSALGGEEDQGADSGGSESADPYYVGRVYKEGNVPGIEAKLLEAAERAAETTITTTAGQEPLLSTTEPHASSKAEPSSKCGNVTTRHFFGGPVGMPGEGIWQEIALLHNVPGVSGARIVVREGFVRKTVVPLRGSGNRRQILQESTDESDSDGDDVSSASKDSAMENEQPANPLNEPIKSGPLSSKGDEVSSEESESCQHGKNASKNLHTSSNIFSGGSLGEVLEKAAHKSGSRVYVYHGLCSWAEGQLEGEIRAGSWGFMVANVDDVLYAAPETLWWTLSRASRLKWFV